MKKNIKFKVILVIIILVAIFMTWKLISNSTVNSKVDKGSLKQLQVALGGITPHFIDTSKANRQILTVEEQKIKNNIISILTSGQPGNKDYYSNIWLNAIGNRYVVISQPSAESSYDEIIDSQTGTITQISGDERYHIRPNGKDSAIYIDEKHIYAYSLDQASAIIVPGSQLLNNETYASGKSDNPRIDIEETHSSNSITITVFDISKRAPNPYLGKGSTMNGEVRKVTFSF